MNLIQRQADDFLFDNSGEDDHKEFISQVRTELWEYKKTPHRIEFIERIINRLKVKFDEHLEVCTEKESGNCSRNKFYENSLFFLQEEFEELESNLQSIDFTHSEKMQINAALQKIIDDLNEIKLSQHITYDDFEKEFEELKDLYFLNKKNWIQLLTGKLTEMVAGGMVSETLSKSLLQTIKINYPNLF